MKDNETPLPGRAGEGFFFIIAGACRTGHASSMSFAAAEGI
jgi:hypothetical protein